MRNYLEASKDKNNFLIARLASVIKAAFLTTAFFHKDAFNYTEVAGSFDIY